MPHDDDDKVEEQDEEQESMRLINTLITRDTKSKVNKAHPGDICQVLASKKGKGERKVNMERFVWVTECNMDHEDDSNTESGDYDFEDEEPPPLEPRAYSDCDNKSEDDDGIPDNRGWQPT
jgi:hypothetical protein